MTVTNTFNTLNWISRFALKTYCLVMFATLFVGAANAQQRDLFFNDGDLVGTWVVKINPGDPSVQPFIGYYTFSADGNASFSSAGPPIPALGNPGYGVWKRSKGNKFASTIMQNSYNTNFQFDGTLKINAKIQMTSRNTFVTQDTVIIYDPSGNEVVRLGGSAQGKRMFVED